MLTCPNCGGIVEIWTQSDLTFTHSEPTAECTECPNKWNRFGSPILEEEE